MTIIITCTSQSVATKNNIQSFLTGNSQRGLMWVLFNCLLPCKGTILLHTYYTTHFSDAPHKSMFGSTPYFHFDATPGHISHCPNFYFAPCTTILAVFKPQPSQQKLQLTFKLRLFYSELWCSSRLAKENLNH